MTDIEKTMREADGRPDNICQKCGYAVCCCKFQVPPKRKKIVKSTLKLSSNAEPLNT